MGWLKGKLRSAVLYRHLRSRFVEYEIVSGDTSKIVAFFARGEKRIASLVPLTKVLKPDPALKDYAVKVKGTAAMGEYESLTLKPAKLGDWSWLRYWQVQYPKGINVASISFNGCLVFHTASSRSDLTDIAFKHMSENGWSAIGYHFVILPDGSIINTRPVGLQGDHCLGFNNSIGICFATDLTRHVLSNVEVGAARSLIKFLAMRNGQMTFFTHQLAQLQVIKQKIADSKSPKSAEYVNMIDVVQEELRYSAPVPASYLREKLRDLWSALNDDDHLRRIVIGKNMPIQSYFKSLKNCPGEHFSFSYFGLLAGPYKGRRWN